MLSVKARSAVGLLIVLWLCCAFVDVGSSDGKSDSESSTSTTSSDQKEEDAVKNVQYKWADKTTLNFSWEPPSSASKSTKYSIKCTLEGKTKSASTLEKWCTFKDLELCGFYQCTFDATDKSSTVKFVTVHEDVQAKIEAPARPEHFTFSVKDLIVSWKNSKTNRHCRTGIKLQVLSEDNYFEEIILPKTADKHKLREKNLLQKTSAIIITVQALGIGNLTSAIVSKTVAGKTTVISNKNSVENVKHSWKTEENDLELKWDPPNESSSVDHYTVTLFRENVKLQTEETKTTEFTFKKLEPCANHKVTFNAYDGDQITKYKTVHYYPDALLKVPGQPVNFSINPYSFVATWNHVVENRYCLTNYHLRIFHDNVCIKDIVLPKDVSKYQLLDINTCSQYAADLQASGPHDHSSKPVTVKFGIGDDVRHNECYIENMSYEVFPQGRVRLKWEAPKIINCVHDFVISYFDWKGLQMKVSNQTSIDLFDLDPCVPHRVVIIPRTSFKEFIGKSNEMKVRTKAFVPGPVRNVYATNDVDGNVLLYWLPPLEYAACVHTYRIRVIRDVHSMREYTTKNLYLNVTSSKKCIHHSFEIVSVNVDGGESEAVDIGYFFVPEDRLIDNVNFEEANNGLTISWKTSAYDKACYELFKVDMCALDHDAPCRTSHATNKSVDGKLTTFIDNVMPCVTYKISISAVETEKQYAFYSEVYRIGPKVFKKPLFHEIMSVTAHEVIIHWIANDFDKNRCLLQFVQLECVTIDNVMTSTLINTTQLSDIVTRSDNLIPFTDYSCTLALINVAGKSDKSSEVKFQTLEAVPSQPIDIAIEKLTSDTVTLSWRPPKETNGVLKGYKVEFTNSRLKYPLPSWCYHIEDINRSITLPASIREYSVQKLSAFTEYTVTVYAGTKVGFGLSSKIQVTTLPNVSSGVTQPQYTSGAPLSYTITWKQPCRPNGILKTFKVTVVGKRKNHIDDVFSYLVAANVSQPDHLYSVKFPKLRPVYKYRVDISAAVAGIEEEGEQAFLEFSTPASLPPVPSAQTILEKMNPHPLAGMNGTMVKITLTPDMFDDSGGEILYYAIIVGRDIPHNNHIESGTRKSLYEWPLTNNWAESSAYDFILAYQATPAYWNPFDGLTSQPNLSVVFTIGEDMSCISPSSTFCNGPLRPDSTYSMRLRAFTEVGFQDSPPVKFSTGTETYSTARTNYLLVICVLVLLAFVVCGVYYVKYGQIPLIVEVRQRMNGKQKLTVSQTTNISIKKFAKYHARLQNTPQILKIEFNELNEISSKFNISDNIGKRYDNYRKNRYLNIIPYDETRVKIQSERGDYINASFIEGYKNAKNRYIACQGPLPETFSDFWNMVLHYDVTVIIMLCQILENKRVVCEKYFPDVNQTLKFDGINVECTLFTSTSLYEERKIIVTKDTKEVTVSHIKFLEWPDFHVPSGPEILVDFCSAVRERFTKNPVIVHCSAGVGRTGTFIACDILLQHLPNNDTVNIFNTVLKLRKQRPHMVQSVAQYIYLYDCIFYAISKLNSKR